MSWKRKSPRAGRPEGFAVQNKHNSDNPSTKPSFVEELCGFRFSDSELTDDSWFAKHETRSHRLRHSEDDESRWVIVRQIKPGSLYTAQWRGPDLDSIQPEDEELCHALFDATLREDPPAFSALFDYAVYLTAAFKVVH